MLNILLMPKSLKKTIYIFTTYLKVAVVKVEEGKNSKLTSEDIQRCES